MPWNSTFLQVNWVLRNCFRASITCSECVLKTDARASCLQPAFQLIEKLLQPSKKLENVKSVVVTWLWGLGSGKTDLVSEWWNCTLHRFHCCELYLSSLCNDSVEGVTGWPYWQLILGYNGKDWRPNRMLLISCFNMIHSLVIWGFPSFRQLWWKKNADSRREAFSLPLCFSISAGLSERKI